MEEGEFVKWKQIVVGLISIMMIFTSVRGEVNENQRSNYQMLEQIEKSYVVDSGFRESNYFFLDMVDSYATYYLQCSELLPAFALHALRGGSFDPKISCFSLTRSQIYRTISDRPNLTNNSVQRANPGVPTGFVQSDSI